MLGLSAIASTAIAALFQPNSSIPIVATTVRGAQNQTVFQLYSAMRILGEFSDVEQGVFVDPGTAVILLLLTPSGILQTLTNVAFDEAGRFHYDFTPTESGVWTYKWQGTGSLLSATSPDTTFTVESSELIAG